MYPKLEGRLGISILRNSVRVFALSLIWCLFHMTDSSWISWIQHYLMHHSSFWDVCDESTGWIWRKLLKMRILLWHLSLLGWKLVMVQEPSSGMMIACILADLSM